jgi:hypothetical protein
VLRLASHQLAESPAAELSAPWLATAMGTDDPSTQTVLETIGAAHPFGAPVWPTQRDPLLRVLWSELSHRAVCEAAPRAGARAPAVAALVDALVAPLVAEPSEALRRATGLESPTTSPAIGRNHDERSGDTDHDGESGGLADRFREATQGIRRPSLPSLPGRTTRPGRTPRATRSPAPKRLSDEPT